MNKKTNKYHITKIYVGTDKNNDKIYLNIK